VLSEQRTEHNSLEALQCLGSTSSDAIFAELRTVLHEVIERTGAFHGTIEALGLTVSSRSDQLARAPKLIASPQSSLRTSVIPGKTLGMKLNADPRSSVQVSTHRQQIVPIFYQGQQTGSLCLHLPPSSERILHQNERDTLGRELGFRLARIEIRHWARYKLDLDIPFVGASSSLALLEAEISKVGAVHFPVVLEGEFGTHDLEFAAAIHCSSMRRHHPFVVVHCSYSNLHEFDLRLNDAWTRATEGSLFVSGIDLLDHAAQRQFLHCLRVSRQSHNAARIMVSTSSPLSLLEGEGKFCRMLRTELDVLNIRIPSLRERREDIRALLEYSLRKHGLEQRRFSPAAWQACLQYHWPENEVELERFAIRIAVMTETSCIDLPDLQGVASWLPAGPFQAAASEGSCWTAPDSDDIYEENEEPTPSQRQWLELLAGRLVVRDFTSLESFGIGMQRALRYVGEHFQDEITLGQLAREAFVSVSHLSFLFKRDVGVPFKTLLASVRIEKARQLLIENGQQSITEISLDAGFGDLSHFERTFKRLIGTNPRDYRRQQLSASGKMQQL
jgi:AraC-like DNA-binding protein